MKKLSVLFICLLLTGFAASAQRGGNGDNHPSSPQERAEKQAKIMKVDLGLDDAQYQKLLALNAKQAEKFEAKRVETKEEMKAKREAMKAEREAYKAELKKILTPAQFEKHEEMTKVRQEERGGQRGKKGKKN